MHLCSRKVHVRFAYIPLTIAYLAFFLTLVPLLGAAHFTSGWAVMLGVSLLVAVPITIHQWRRNRRAMAMYLLVLLVIPLVSAIGVMTFHEEALGAALSVVVVSTFCVLVLVRALWLEYHVDDRLPNHISEQFLDEETFEDDGVQWAVQCTGNDAATPLHAIVHLQNNIDAHRTVTIRVRAETPFVGGSGTLRIAPIAPVQLPPAAEATVTVPFVASETKPRKRIDAYVSVSAKGPPGERNRRQRVGPGPRPIPRWLVVLSPLAGHFIFQRGGMRIALRSSGAASTYVQLEPVVVDLRGVETARELFGGVIRLPPPC